MNERLHIACVYVKYCHLVLTPYILKCSKAKFGSGKGLKSSNNFIESYVYYYILINRIIDDTI